MARILSLIVILAFAYGLYRYWHKLGKKGLLVVCAIFFFLQPAVIGLILFIVWIIYMIDMVNREIKA